MSVVDGGSKRHLPLLDSTKEELSVVGLISRCFVESSMFCIGYCARSFVLDHDHNFLRTKPAVMCIEGTVAPYGHPGAILRQHIDVPNDLRG